MRNRGKGRKQRHDIGRQKAVKSYDAKMAARRRHKARKRSERAPMTSSTGFIHGIPHRST